LASGPDYEAQAANAGGLREILRDAVTEGGKTSSIASTIRDTAPGWSWGGPTYRVGPNLGLVLGDEIDERRVVGVDRVHGDISSVC
jgi:hypothetical protein